MDFLVKSRRRADARLSVRRAMRSTSSKMMASGGGHCRVGGERVAVGRKLGKVQKLGQDTLQSLLMRVRWQAHRNIFRQVAKGASKHQ
jgi:hypothetical protein